MKLIAELLYLQDPAKPHTLLTRVIVSIIVAGASVVYAGFFGVLGAVAVYLFGVELLGIDLRWIFLPIGLSVILGLKSGIKELLDYWRYHGHGESRTGS